MSSLFEKIHSHLQHKKTDCVQLQEYLLFSEKYQSLHTYLTQRIGNLEDYFFYLKKEILEDSASTVGDDIPASRSEIHAVEFLGGYLLTLQKITLEALNSILAQIPLAKLTTQELLQRLFSQRKISVTEFMELRAQSYTPPLQNKNDYEIRCVSNRAEFICKSVDSKKTFGHYQLFEELGRGAMGIVYKAYHPGLNRFFALKTIKDSSENTKKMQRFFREMQVLAKLNHPGIVTLFDSGEAEQTLYFVMELIEGVPLSQWLQEDHSLREKISFFKKTLDALHYAHLQGVIHRDLKPDNIFITTDSEPKIMDFGLAYDLEFTQEQQKLTQTGAIMGTPAYMSPEQAKGETRQISKASDIYAIGACFYEALTGRRPFIAKSISELFQQIITKDPRPPSTRKTGIHPDLDTIVLKALEKEPSLRYATADSFAQDLERFLSGYPIHVKSSSLIETLRKWSKRNQKRLLFYGIAVGFLLSLLLTGFFLHQFQKKSLFEMYIKQASEDYFEMKGSENKFLRASEKLRSLLQAFKNLSFALAIFPKENSAENLKWNIGQEIVALTCEMNSYSFAYYLAEELAELTSISKEKKQELWKSIWEKQKFLLKQHIHRLLYWKNKLMENENAFFSEDAIFEINKMTEKEVVVFLLKEFQESCPLYGSAPAQRVKNNSWYTLVVVALGQRNDPALGVELWKSLKILGDRVSSLPEDQKNLFTIRYMITIAVALSNSRTPDFASKLQEIRNQMGDGSFFWRATKRAHRKLIRYNSKKQQSAQSVQESLELAFDKITEKNYLEAIDICTEILRLDPKNWNAYNYRGNARTHLSKFREAIEDYNLALQLLPNSVFLYDNRGRAKLEFGDLAGAIEDLTVAIQIDPTYESAYIRRGTTKIDLGDYTGAIQDLDVAIRLNSQSGEAYLFRGNAKQFLKDWTGSIADYTLAIQVEPFRPKTHNNRGIVRLNKGDVEGAIQDFTTAVEQNPQYAYAYYNRGNAKVLKKDLAGAIQDFSEAIRLNPNFMEAYYNRGTYMLEQNQNANALPDFQKFLELAVDRKDPQTLQICKDIENRFPPLKKDRK